MYQVSTEQIDRPVQPGFLSGPSGTTELPKEHSAEEAVAFIFNHPVAFAGTRFKSVPIEDGNVPMRIVNQSPVL
jgi:hypothetical protein